MNAAFPLKSPTAAQRPEAVTPRAQWILRPAGSTDTQSRQVFPMRQILFDRDKCIEFHRCERQ